MNMQSAHLNLRATRKLTPIEFSFSRIALALQVAAERRALAKLDIDALADIGLTQADVARETRRGFWDLPDGR